MTVDTVCLHPQILCRSCMGACLRMIMWPWMISGRLTEIDNPQNQVRVTYPEFNLLSWPHLLYMWSMNNTHFVFSMCKILLSFDWKVVKNYNGRIKLFTNACYSWRFDVWASVVGPPTYAGPSGEQAGRGNHVWSRCNL